jgi:predicted GIY-YIG superfamily endonuclease
MAQLLLMPNARPLEDRLGRTFFHKAPRRPGVYLMKDAADNVLYVGKAKNLRQRLNNYRIANPDRMPRRHLRMVREVTRIEFKFSPTETLALAHEARLLRSLKPKFNRAGVWPGKIRFLVWRMRETRLELSVAETPEPDWQRFGPLGANAVHLQRALARLMWLALNPTRELAGLPHGWAHGRFLDSVTLHCGGLTDEIRAALDTLFWGSPGEFISWLGSKFAERVSPFERNAIQSDLEILENFGSKQSVETASHRQLKLL